MSNTNWANDTIQFPRVLAEIHAIGLTDGQMRQLEDGMDCSEFDIGEILNRATEKFDEIKEMTVGDVLNG
jgi:hypothetical protein